MKSTWMEKIEKIKSIRYHLQSLKSHKPMLYLSDIETICGNTVNREVDVKRRISFVGFYNDFEDVYGQDCVYIHLFSEPEKEWLAKRAVNHGALAVVSAYEIADLPCIVVDDVWHVLKELSCLYINSYCGGRVAIAGSIGKTTTKEMVECVLKKKYHTFCTPINGNVLSYLAYEIQHMPNHIEQFVQEVDESYPNNANDCSYVFRPSIAIITSIDNSHVGLLGSEKAVEKAILDVTAYMPKEGIVIINKDDPKSKTAVIQHNIISVGIHDLSADCIASKIVSDDKSVDFVVSFQGEKTSIHLNCPGEHNVYNAMFAYVVGKLSGLSAKQICRGIDTYRPMTIRQNTYNILGRTLYVDCFNASPRSIGAALDVLKKMKPSGKGRRIAILGDIAEVEGFEKQTYRMIADAVLNCDIDQLVTYGKDSKQIWENLGKTIQGCHIESESELYHYVKQDLRAGDKILIKGSGVVHLERVVRKAFPITYNVKMLPYRIKVLRWRLNTL